MQATLEDFFKALRGSDLEIHLNAQVEAARAVELVGWSDRALLKTNLEAAGEIARLLRLRRMGGIILIDFIDMVSSQDREEVLIALRDALNRDPVKTVVHGFTQLGLVEMTRKKADEPLASERLIPCPRCRGTGFAQRPSEDTQPPHKEEPDDAP